MSAPSAQYKELPIELLRAIDQVRVHFDDASIEELAQSLVEVGMQQPLLVRASDDGTFTILDGERRFRAAKRAGLKTVPVLIEGQKLDAAQILQRQLIANLQRVDLNEVEKATGIEQLLRHGRTGAQVAAMLGIHASGVTRYRSLLTLPEHLIAAVRNCTLDASKAYELAKERDPGRREEFAVRAINGEWSAEALRAERRRSSQKTVHTGKGGRTGPSWATTTIVVDAVCAVSVSLAEPDFDRVKRALNKAASLVSRGQASGVSMPTFLLTLKERARHETTVVVKPTPA